MQNKKSLFIDKFSKYINSKVTQQRTNQMFKGQFNASSDKSYQICQTSIFPFSGLKANNYRSSDKQGNLEDEPCSQTVRLSAHQNQHSNSQQRRQQQSVVKRKRLKKLKEIQENVCGICLDQITKRCQLDCKHKFCFDCLQKWFQTSNKCPFCRCEVSSFWFKGQQFMVEKRQPAQDDYSYYSEQQSQRSMDYVCYNCEQTKEGDIVLICDRCEVNSCHVECDQTLRGRQPRGNWYCHFCR